jgi:two-component system osmolarity sensor histidine kinase EnvZ
MIIWWQRVFDPIKQLHDTATREFARIMPKGLYARALLIVIVPVVVLQSVIAYVFLERHWQLVTQRLSSAVTADISALIDVYERYPQTTVEAPVLVRIAAERLQLDVDFLVNATLPPPSPKPFFSLLDRALSEEIRRQVARPFWVDTVGRSNLIEIRIQLDRTVMRIIARRSMAYASNSHIFLLWMVGSSLVLLTMAVVILRNQIRPIIRLAEAAESFGKGRDVDFRPRGATEVRKAGHAFIEMKRRIERTMEQRTTMLNGVSHDLRTILTRFKLSLALFKPSTDVEALKRDVDEMSRMLEGYLAFARGDGGEEAIDIDLSHFLNDIRDDLIRHGAHDVSVIVQDAKTIHVRPDLFKRCITNLASNAARHGQKVILQAAHEGRWLMIHVDDNGPGVPFEKRDEVFKPFVRLDEARNQDEGGSGLGLAIARDAARAHGGDITLSDSAMGGLRASVRIPV